MKKLSTISDYVIILIIVYAIMSFVFFSLTPIGWGALGRISYIILSTALCLLNYQYAERVK